MRLSEFSTLVRRCWTIAAAIVAVRCVTGVTAHAQPCGGMQDLGTLGEVIYAPSPRVRLAV